MMEAKEKISGLFLDIERDAGTTHLNASVLDALSKSIHDFVEAHEQDFLAQFKGLLELVKNTEPRIALIIDHLYHLGEDLEEARKTDHEERQGGAERKGEHDKPALKSAA